MSASDDDRIERWLAELDRKCEGKPLAEIADIVRAEVARFKRREEG